MRRLSAALLCWLLPVIQVLGQPDRALRVPADYPTITAALSAARDGAIIRVWPGEYRESLVIDRPLELHGVGGEVVLTSEDDEPVVTVRDTRLVTLRGLTLVGGQYGVLVIRSRDVLIHRNLIRESRIAGIKVRLGAAEIVANTISDALPPYGRGIHITNTMDWPETVIRGNTVTGNAAGGIVTNMAIVSVRNNTVTGNGGRGIAITEMTEALVANNQVEANSGNGIYISDQSLVMVCDNTIHDSSLAELTEANRYGNGITVDYLAEAELHDNIVTGNAGYGLSVMAGAKAVIGDNIFDDNGTEAVWVEGSARGQQAGSRAVVCQRPSR